VLAIPEGGHHPGIELYKFRQIFEFPEFETFKQEAFLDDIQRFKEWKLGQINYDTRFGYYPVAGKGEVLDHDKIADDQKVAKRIITKILKERAIGREKFEPEQWKRNFIAEFSKSPVMSDYHKRMTQLEPDREETEPTEGVPMDRQTTQGIIVENAIQDNWLGKKKQNAEAKTKHYLNEVKKIIKSPDFVHTYFKSKNGQIFTKENPEKPPSQELIMRMSQRINRSQRSSEKGKS